MIKISKEEENYIEKYIIDNFTVNNREAKEWTDGIKQLIENDIKDIYSEIQCISYFRKDIDFNLKIINAILNIYIYLYDRQKSNSSKDRLKELFLDFHIEIYGKKLLEFKHLQRREIIKQNLLKHLTQKLQKMLDSQTLMLASISHDMRTSLNTINGYITILKEGNYSKSDELKYINRLNDASNSLNTLIQDILDATKISIGDINLNISKFWLGEIVMKSINSVINIAKKKELKIKSSIDFFPYPFYGDEQRLLQVLLNLLTNAIKFTNKGEVSLRVDIVEDNDEFSKILFEVRDTGIGISKDDIDNIFNPFIKYNKSLEGVGLGLYISKNIISKMGGVLKVKSSKNSGTTFSFELSLKKDRLDFNILNSKKFYFLNENKNCLNREFYDKRIDHFRDNSKDTHFFANENRFITYLIDKIQRDDYIAPNTITITLRDGKEREYDAMVSYLKSTGFFNNTLFILEKNNSNFNFKNFDHIFEYYLDIFFYIKNIDNKNSPNILQSIKMSNFKILAVDDIESNLDILNLFIKKYYPEIEVDIVTDPFKAIEYFSKNDYNIIFLDIKMPIMSGFELIEKLKSIKRLPKIYALTADAYRKTYDKVIELGFDDLIQKPIKLEKIKYLIGEVLNDRRYH